MNNTKLKKAFTLVELVIVIAVIAILAVVVVPSFVRITKQSDINSDNEEIVSINFALAMYESDYGIYSEQELKKAYDATFGKDSFYSIQPKSARYGYHFWYCIATNKVTLATTEELLESISAQASLQSELNLYEPQANYGQTENVFTANSLRSKLVDGYILLDRSGSAAADAVSEIDNIVSGRANDVSTSYSNAINNACNLSEGDGYDEMLEGTMLAYLEKTALVTDDATLRYGDLQYVTEFVFEDNLSVISSSLITYSYTGEKEGCTLQNRSLIDQNDASLPMQNPALDAVVSVAQSATYNLPIGVSTVSTNSLWFNKADSTVITLATEYVKKEDIISIFRPSATNAEIIIPGIEDAYTIDRNMLMHRGEIVGYLGDIIAVENFDLLLKNGEQTAEKLTQNGEDKVVLQSTPEGGYTLYIAYDYSGEIALTASNFTPAEPTSTTVTYSCDDSAVLNISTHGVITIPAGSNGGEVTVQATALAGGLIKEVKVKVVRVDFATLNLGDLANGGITLTVDKTAEQTVSYEYSESVSNVLPFGALENVTLNLLDAPVTLSSSLLIETVNQDETIYIETDPESGAKSVVINSDSVGDRSIVFSVTVGGYLKKTFTLTVIDGRLNAFELKFKKTNEFLYRVGNQNALPLKSLFGISNDVSGVTLEIKNALTDTLLTEDSAFGIGYYPNVLDENWESVNLQFIGTGVAKLTLKYQASETRVVDLSLLVEVVNAKNVTDYSQFKMNESSVLLNDIIMPTSTTFAIVGATLYGNDFNFDVTRGVTRGGDILTKNCVVYMRDAALDNVRLKGAVYTTYGVTVSEDYNNALVLASGDCTITNSILSNCATPLRITDGNVKIINTTLKGGVFSNLDIRGGHVEVDNLTTINQSNLNDAASDGSVPVGLGITFFYENVPSDATLTVKNTITQYNHLSRAEAATIKECYSNEAISKNIDSIITKLFESDEFSAFVYDKGGENECINTGILLLCDNKKQRVIHGRDSNVSSYAEHEISYSVIESLFNGNYQGYLFAPGKEHAPSVPENEYKSAGQYAIAPKTSFDFESKNYDEKGDGNTSYCYYDSSLNHVAISFNEGDSFTWDSRILTVTNAFNTALDCSVSITPSGSENGVVWLEESKSYTFSRSGEYLLTYSYTDNEVYSFNLTAMPVTYQKTLKIKVNVILAGAKQAEFTFAGEASPAQKISVGNVTYLNPNDASGVKVNYGGKAINVKRVEVVMSDGKTEHDIFGWYAYFPVFNNVVSITDYANGGTGEAINYNGSTVEMPDSLVIVGDASEIFKYSSSSQAASDPIAVDGALYFSSPKISADRDAFSLMVEYVYTDNTGETYHYFIEYYAPAQNYQSLLG